MKVQKWDANSISSQQGRIVIVTGSSSGIGFETALALASKEATVIIAVRNLQKGNSAAAKIKTEFPEAKVDVMELDLANLASVRKFSEDFKAKYEKLDLLINNAGVMVPPYSKTSDGFELQFGTNHIGHFALTGLLIERLHKTVGSRIVNVSSSIHKAGKINFDDLSWEKRKYGPWSAYGASKIANLYFTYEFRRRIGEKPIIAAAHPGLTATDLPRHSGMADFLYGFLAQKAQMGALPTLYAAVGPDVKSGDYYGPSGFMEMKGYAKKVQSNALSHDTEIAKKLWDVSEELSGVKWSI